MPDGTELKFCNCDALRLFPAVGIITMQTGTKRLHSMYIEPYCYEYCVKGFLSNVVWGGVEKINAVLDSSKNAIEKSVFIKTEQ